MAKVTKRSWEWKGARKSAWVLTYFDATGKRTRAQYATKAEADAERVRVEGQLAAGVHVPDKTSITVLDAAKAFLADFEALVEADKRERSTLRSYEQQVHLHMKPHAIAKVKLSRLGGPDCTAFARSLEANLSDAMATRVFSLLRHILKFSQGSGWISTNPAAAVSIRVAGERSDEEGQIEIPPKAQIKALLDAAVKFDNTGFAEAWVSLLIFGGLRASEMRGLRRRDLMLADSKIRVAQRADRWNQIGPCKTKNSRRSIPIPQSTVAALKRWLIAAPVSELGLVFPNGFGNVESYANLYNRFWCPLMEAAGLVDAAAEGEAKKVTPWFGFHALRHVACSLWIEQGAQPKRIQSWAGHASIQFTMDRYGHLWTDEASDQATARGAELSILG